MPASPCTQHQSASAATPVSGADKAVGEAQVRHMSSGPCTQHHSASATPVIKAVRAKLVTSASQAPVMVVALVHGIHQLQQPFLLPVRTESVLENRKSGTCDGSGPCETAATASEAIPVGNADRVRLGQAQVRHIGSGPCAWYSKDSAATPVATLAMLAWAKNWSNTRVAHKHLRSLPSRSQPSPVCEG